MVVKTILPGGVADAVRILDIMSCGGGGGGTGLGFGIIGGRSTGVVVKTILPGGVADAVRILDIMSLGGLYWDLVLLGVGVQEWLLRLYYLEESQMRYVYLISCLWGGGIPVAFKITKTHFFRFDHS